MGLPINKLIVATNKNDILQRVINTGEYKPDTVKATITPSMDIQVASNFERLLYYILDENDSKVVSLMSDLSSKNLFNLERGEIDRIKKAIGKNLDSPKHLKLNIDKKETFDIIGNSNSEVKNYILGKIQ